ncbi:hypothetical protein IAQ61_000125 [Plenodomus lingam]|uniref:Predicted protein n=1 Tax=Leptosphaeria maculans (strain JN3 / isolate v23.1.3 / race Av1-4-5-6-7-8) TaxID=985895 RepID=E5R4E8_LEPMJ|nr:predicted protein [Plenodomus lingam JN3]KAH9881401.1 hypothetical protein IAQ61_000125 [Plenodomus lingam]CBX91916.1 predicted protein [Plenodomus lingam JN3]
MSTADPAGSTPPPGLEWLREWAGKYTSCMIVEHLRGQSDVPYDQLEWFIQTGLGWDKLSGWERSIGLVDTWMQMTDDEQTRLVHLVKFARGY